MSKIVNLASTQVSILQMDKKGEMQNVYSPLQNLQNLKEELGDFTTKNLKFDKNNPVDILVTDEYDGSSNLIINDDQNKPQLINNRFAVQENNTFNIPVHSGNKVTNIYDESTFDVDSSLLKLYNTIPTLEFDGLAEGGGFKCGSYVFYFKYADADGNLTNVVQESGIVQVHMGTPHTKKVRMGMQDENSGKLVKFTLSNIDAGFDYVRVFYERSSTDDSQALIKQYFMIDRNFPIRQGKCEFNLTGAEKTLQISKSDLQTQFADIQTVKTQDVVANTLFLGNVSSYELDYRELQAIAWRIIPTLETSLRLNNVSSKDYSMAEGSGFYNTKSVYYNVGYWPEEYYRFGIVFIYKNNLLSPVFNIQGCILDDSLTPLDYFNTDYTKRDSDPEDGFFNKNHLMNSKGVIKFPSSTTFVGSSSFLSTSVINKIKFSFDYIGSSVLDIDENDNIKTKEYDTDVDENNLIKSVFDKHNIKGFFFVRQKRIPTIIALGLVTGLTSKDNGCIPVIKNRYNDWITKSFLHSSRMLVSDGSDVEVKKSNVSNLALLVPDYDVNEATLNQIFTGLEFQLERVGHVDITNENNHYFPSRYTNTLHVKANDIKLTAIPKNTKIRTDGENYFSSLAGSPDEPYKTADVNNIWNKTVPQDLTTSTSLIRGIWGSYVGMSKNKFQYGDIVNIRLNTAKDKNADLLEFKKRFVDYSLYSAISPRVNVSDYKSFTPRYLTCARGDCFQSVFTHRMMSNFIDPELPTNTKIIDPSCWAKNYLVRCTAEILNNTHSNLGSDSGGFYIPSPIDKKSAIKSLIFAILSAQPGLIINASEKLADSYNDPEPNAQDIYANEITQTFEVKVSNLTDEGKIDNPELSKDSTLADLAAKGLLSKVDPKEQEVASGGLNLKAIFKADDKYELHGLAQINRADVNAVSFGQWITFPVCSSYNLAFRDIEFNLTTEEAKMNKKRAFYPYEEMNPEDHLVESGIINGAAKVSISDYDYPVYTTRPYIKQEYFNRIYWSKPNVAQQYINSYRMIYNTQYREYNKEFGAITKIVGLGESLLVVFQHGIGLLPVNRSPQDEREASPYLPHKSVLPTQVAPISNDYGSMWKDSVIRTPNGMVYGVDTVAKKIWRTNGLGLEFISDHKISKFLNDHVDLSEFDYNEYVGHINVKTHYNAFKHDVMFTYYRDIPMTYHHYDENGDLEWIDKNLKDTDESIAVPVDLSGNLVLSDTLDPKPLIDYWKPGKTWSICYNEEFQNWITFYDWIPLESCNVDNIFFSFDKEEIDDVLDKKQEDTFDPVQVLKNGDQELPYIYMNKAFMDKAFTHNTKVYISSGTSTDSISADSVSYISYYYLQDGSLPGPIKSIADPTLTDNAEIEYSSNKYSLGRTTIHRNQNTDNSSDNWVFVVIDVREDGTNPRSIRVNFNQNYKIAELRFHTAAPENVDDPILKYWNFRNSEGREMYLWKHGMAGLYDNQGKIKPTNWYGKLHEFNFEFIVNDTPGILKIFNNLILVSNKTAPYKFEYEVVGEGYDWYIYKDVIRWINNNIDKLKEKDKSEGLTDLEKAYHYVLSNKYEDLIKDPTFPVLFGFDKDKYISKLPFMSMQLLDQMDDIRYNPYPDKWRNKDGTVNTPLLNYPGVYNTNRLTAGNIKDSIRSGQYSWNSSETCLIEDSQLNEGKVHTESLGQDIKKYGRLRGNMLYLEDSWKVEIRPIIFKYAYLDNGEFALTKRRYETRHRDKFIRVKIRYDGEDLALIQGISTLFDVSQA